MFGKRKNKESGPEEFTHASGSPSLDLIVNQHVPEHLTAVPRGRDARMHLDDKPMITLPEAELA